MQLKPWLVDVPVKLNIWVRPECQRRQFEVIQQARPSILFIQSDGGRNEEEWRIINEHRRMFQEEIDWDCTVYRIYSDHNCGMYAMERQTLAVIWSTVDRCVFLEDDDLPTVSFFRFCAELLEKYKDDERIFRICGMNNFDVREGCTSDYFFSRCGSIWGTAYWKRSFEEFGDFEYGKDPYTMHILRKATEHDGASWNQIDIYANGRLYRGHVAGEEYYARFSQYGYHQLQIIPTRNLISNIGYGESSAHADELRTMPQSMRSQFNTRTYELDFPLRHPRYVIADVEYEEWFKRLICDNRPIRKMIQRMQRFFLMVRYGQFDRAFDKLRARHHQEKEM